MLYVPTKTTRPHVNLLAQVDDVDIVLLELIITYLHNIKIKIHVVVSKFLELVLDENEW